MLYICTNFQKIILDGFNIFRTDANNVGCVTVLVLCTSSDRIYICVKFREILMNGIRVMERTQMMGR